MDTVKNEVSAYLENILLLLLGILFLLFPLLFTTATTDPFSLSKQTLLAVVSLSALLLFAAKMVSDRTLRLRRTPFDLPVFLFLVFSLLSSFFAVNRYDSLTALVPLLLAISAFYLLVNVVKNEASLLFLSSSLVIGATIAGLINFLSYFNVYVIPLQDAHFKTFNTFGSLLDQGLYLTFVLLVAGYFALPIFKSRDLSDIKGRVAGFAAAFVILAACLGLTIYELVAVQRPLLLPFETGFQTAFAAISQDAGRILQGFLLGSGFGTYLVDFSRFKQASYNLNPALWSFSFFRSTSFVLELLATTGLLGLLSYFFIVFRVVRGEKVTVSHRTNPFYLSLLLVIIQLMRAGVCFV